jgi:hypothetical protein
MTRTNENVRGLRPRPRRMSKNLGFTGPDSGRGAGHGHVSTRHMSGLSGCPLRDGADKTDNVRAVRVVRLNTSRNDR